MLRVRGLPASGMDSRIQRVKCYFCFAGRNVHVRLYSMFNRNYAFEIAILYLRSGICWDKVFKILRQTIPQSIQWSRQKKWYKGNSSNDFPGNVWSIGRPMSSWTRYERLKVAEVKVPDKDGYPPSHDGEVLRNIFERSSPAPLESQILRENPKSLSTSYR